MLKKYFIPVLSSLFLVACTNDKEERLAPTEVSDVTMMVKDFVYEKDSRTTVSIDNYGVHYAWAEGDVVGIFPDEGTQAAFPINAGFGQSVASFNGGGWALKPSHTYAAYYPFIQSLEVAKNAVPVNYAGQTQTGKHSTAHIGQFDYNAAVATTPAEGRVRFKFDHLGAFVRVCMNLPEGNYHKLTFTSDEKIFVQTGTFDLSSPTINIIPKETSNTFTINLKDFNITQESEDVEVYFMSAPLDLAGKTVRVSLDAELDGINDKLNVLLTIPKKWNAGRAYSYTLGEFYQGNWVDLGLPSRKLWADHNVGANSPFEAGDFFRWGSIEPKPLNENPSYTDRVPFETKDFSGDSRYDAATAIWGVPARMPNYVDIEEIRKYCTFTHSGNGTLVKSKINGNCIYLPLEGYYDNNGIFQTSSWPSGIYWSSVRGGTTADKADGYFIHHDANNEVTKCLMQTYEIEKWWGHIRPIFNVNPLSNN